MIFLALPLTVLFCPTDTFMIIKRERMRNLVLPSFLLILLLAVTRLLYIRLLNYTVSPYNLNVINVWTDIGIYIAVLLSWSIATYSISAIMDGSTLFKESFFATSLCAMPLIALHLPIVFISKTLGRSESSIFAVLQFFMWAWVVILLFRSLMVLNDYSFFKTCKVCIVSIIFIAVFWSVLLMLVVFTKNLWNFVYGFVIEFAVHFS